MRNALLIGTIAFTASTLIAQSNSPGNVNFSVLMQTNLNPYISSPTSSTEQWFQKNMMRMGVFSPYFDSSTSWYSNGLAYQDLYGIQPGTNVFYQHPEWILHDQYGNWLYIPFDCVGTCPSYAGDISNPAFRAWWISQAQAIFTRGNYRGLWIDDVNMNFNVSDGFGNLVAPIDFNTGLPMTYAAWRSYVAQFTQQIRQSFPNQELVENSVWFAGPTGVQDADSYIQQQLATATNVNLERGIANDPGLTGGTGPWSVYAFFAYVDLVHSLGPSVTLEEYQVDSTQQQYGLASYFMISNGNDRIGDMSTTPANWWSGYSTALGAPLGPRTYSNGVFQRNFANGVVLLGEPNLATQTVSLPGTYQTLAGTIVTGSVSITGWQGIILLNQSPASSPAPPAPASGVTRYLSSITPTYVFNSWGVLQENKSILGNPITLDGIVYPYGMGVHAYSELHFAMYGNCYSLSATVGVDDEIPLGLGNLDFQVWADGTKLYDSGYLQSGSAAPSFHVNLTGYQTLGLVVTNGIYQAAAWQVPVDHADWANAIITCAD
jgi:NPCBM/NEW2 domain/Hypothetical glycosyl hydrolase family 15